MHVKHAWNKNQCVYRVLEPNHSNTCPWKQKKILVEQSKDTRFTEVIMVPRNIRIHSKYFWEHQSVSLSIVPTKHHGELSAALLPVPGTHSHPTSILSTLYLCSNSVQNSSVQNSLLCQTVFYFILLFIIYYFIVCGFCLFYGIYSILVKCPWMSRMAVINSTAYKARPAARARYCMWISPSTHQNSCPTATVINRGKQPTLQQTENTTQLQNRRHMQMEQNMFTITTNANGG